MKTLGLIGGISWESTAHYYQLLNQGVRDRLGGFHSAPLLLRSYDFDQIKNLQASGDWELLGQMLAEAARGLEAGGAEVLLICANTMHKVAEPVRAAVKIPLLHLAEVSAAALRAAGRDCIGLLGTRFTMQERFYREVLEAAGIKVLVPESADLIEVDRIIFAELVLGRFETAARETYLQVIDRLAKRGAQGILLGCTEIGLLVHNGQSSLPLFDTTALHVEAALSAMLA
ncbi:MAG: aspartate/glutamate racemase family protein [Candidatus Sericytochromatia bacterium]